MLKVAQENTRSNVDATTRGGSLLDEIVRDGARQMLAAALAAEAAAYVERYAHEVDEHGHRLVVRNGYHQPREVVTAAGAVPVRQPRVNDRCTDEATCERKRVRLGDPARVGAQVPAAGRGAAAAVPARPVQQRLRSGARAVPGYRGRVVREDDHPADRAVAGRGGRVQPAFPGRDRLRVRVGRRDPPQGPLDPGQGVPAGHGRRPRGRHEGADRPRRRAP